MKLHFPEDLVIGFQERSDSMTGKLAYVVYKDKNKIRKEKSFNSWRNHALGVENMKNIPREGFLISKTARRDSYHFGSGRSLMRIYDPEGFDFEITVDNLEYILQNCNTNKGELEGKFCYMWSGAELVLVPEGSEVYNASVVLKKDVNSKVVAKDLKVGAIYKDKKTDTTFTYLGRYNYYKEFSNAKIKDYLISEKVEGFDSKYSSYSGNCLIKPIEQKPKKQHIFFNNSSKTFEPNVMTKLSYLVAEEDESYQDLLSDYFETANAKKRLSLNFKKYDSKDLKNLLLNDDINKAYYNFNKNAYVHIAGNYYYKLNIRNIYEFDTTGKIFKFDASSIYFYDKKACCLRSVEINYFMRRNSGFSYRNFLSKNLTKDNVADFIKDARKSLDELRSCFESDTVYSSDIFKTKAFNIIRGIKSNLQWTDILLLEKLDLKFKSDYTQVLNNHQTELFVGGTIDDCLNNLDKLDVLYIEEVFDNI